MVVIITITSKNEFVYKDKVDNSKIINYVGQRSGKRDYILKKGIQNNEMFKIYYRKRNGRPFVFIGESRDVSIVRERTKELGKKGEDNELLEIKIKLEVIVNRIINPVDSTQFKKGVFLENEIPQNTNIQCGIYKI